MSVSTTAPTRGELGKPTRLAQLLRLLSLPALLLLWEISARGNSAILIPSPSAVAERLWQMSSSKDLWQALAISNQALLLGTSLALLLGIPLGIVLGRSRLLNRIFGIYVDIDLAIPAVALLPLIILIFGIDLSARVATVFVFCFSLVVAMVRTGALTVDERLVEMAEAFAPSRLQLWRKVLLPGMLPALAATLRIAVSRGVVGMIIVELTLIPIGMGGLIMDARAYFRADVVFAGVLVVCLEGLLLIAAARWLEKRIAPAGLYGSAS